MTVVFRALALYITHQPICKMGIERIDAGDERGKIVQEFEVFGWRLSVIEWAFDRLAADLCSVQINHCRFQILMSHHAS